MTHETSIKLDVKYRIDTYAIGQEIRVVPIITEIDGHDRALLDPAFVTIVMEHLYNDDPEFNDRIDGAKRIGKLT